MSVRARLTLVLALAASAASLSLATPGQATPARHLYLAVFQKSGTDYAEVLRYKLVNGFPEKSPDLAYDGVSWPMAIAPDGTFYATVPMGCCFGEAQINVYPPNSNTPAREITLPQLSDTTIANAITVAPNGLMYVGYDAFISGAGTRMLAPETSSGTPLHGIFVYPPNANGSSPPSLAYKFFGIQGGPAALVLGPQRELYASGFNGNRQGQLNGYVFEIVRPWQGPNIVGHLSLGPINITGMTFSDETRDLYMLSFNRFGSQILVYPRGELGKHAPQRIISTPNDFGPSLAIAGDNVYTSAFGVASNTPELIAYPKHANGMPKPTFDRMLVQFGTTQGVITGP